MDNILFLLYHTDFVLFLYPTAAEYALVFTTIMGEIVGSKKLFIGGKKDNYISSMNYLF